MFNKKKKRIIELDKELRELYKDYKIVCMDVDNLKVLLEKTREKNVELTKINNGFAQTIDKQAFELENANKKIKELENCFKPQITMCEENPSEPKKNAEKVIKTTETKPKKTSKRAKKA